MDVILLTNIIVSVLLAVAAGVTGVSLFRLSKATENNTYEGSYRSLHVALLALTVLIGASMWVINFSLLGNYIGRWISAYVLVLYLQTRAEYLGGHYTALKNIDLTSKIKVLFISPWPTLSPSPFLYNFLKLGTLQVLYMKSIIIVAALYLELPAFESFQAISAFTLQIMGVCSMFTAMYCCRLYNSMTCASLPEGSDFNAKYWIAVTVFLMLNPQFIIVNYLVVFLSEKQSALTSLFDDRFDDSLFNVPEHTLASIYVNNVLMACILVPITFFARKYYIYKEDTDEYYGIDRITPVAAHTYRSKKRSSGDADYESMS